jgi:molybdate transport repressor ModE-like protein
MMRIQISPHWGVSQGAEGSVDTTELLLLLAAIQESGAIAQAARSLGLSYRHAWGQVKRAEQLFGHPLVDAGRGRGSTLTPLADKLIWADRRIAARLSPLLSSLASELEHELERILPRKASAVAALRLHASHGFAVAALVEQLELASGQAIRPGETLLFLDEIQACPRGVTALRYFHEELPALHVVAAGSLLEFSLSEFQQSMPVGRVTFRWIPPISFRDYLKARQSEILLSAIANILTQ